MLKRPAKALLAALAGRMAGRMRKGWLLLSVLAFTTALAGQGKGKGKAAGEPGQTGTAVSVSVAFSDTDRRVIQEWVRGVPSGNLPPGLAKRGELPPGLQKQLQKNGALPPGLQKRITPFPSDLTKRLGPLPDNCGCDRVFLEGRALIVVRATRAILDVFAIF